MKRRMFMLGLLVMVVAIFASALGVTKGLADTGAAATATPWVYDPDLLGNSSSVWESSGGQDVLDLQKNADTSSNEAAGATIDGFAGDPLFEVGFDYRGYCGAGAPRINIYSGDFTAFFGCAHGTHTSLPDGWTHVEFASCEDTIEGDGTGGVLCNYDEEDVLTIIDGGDVVQDEGPAQTELRNITINGLTLGPPAPPTLAQPVFVPQSNRAGYCADHAVARPGQDAGRFLDLLLGQNTSKDPAWGSANAVPAFERPNHSLTCDLYGYHTTGQTDGIYPLIVPNA